MSTTNPKDFEQSANSTMQDSGRGVQAAVEAAAKFASQDYVGGTIAIVLNLKYILAAILMFVILPLVLLIMLPSVLLATMDSALDTEAMNETYAGITDKINGYFISAYESAYDNATNKANNKAIALGDNYEISIQIITPYGINTGTLPQDAVTEANEIMAIHGVVSQHDTSSEYNDLTVTTWDSLDELDSPDDVYDRKFFKTVRKYARNIYSVSAADYEETGTRTERRAVIEDGEIVLDEDGNPVYEDVIIHIGTVTVEITKKNERFMRDDIDSIKESAWLEYQTSANNGTVLRVKTQADVENQIEQEIAEMKSNLDAQFRVTGGHNYAAANRAQTILAFIGTEAYNEWSSVTVPVNATMPYPSSEIYSGYGMRTLYGEPNFHTGIDFSGSIACHRANIPAIADGYVVYAYGECTVDKDPSAGYGNLIILYHGKKNGTDLFTVYGHCESVYVSTGQTVTQGQTIGIIGQRGNSTGPHLHFETNVIVGGEVKADDPHAWLLLQ